MIFQKISIFLVITMLISLLKTLSIALFGQPDGFQTEMQLMTTESGRAVLVEVIPGSGVQMPFSQQIEVKARYAGAYRILYPVVPGTGMRDTRYRSILK